MTVGGWRKKTVDPSPIVVPPPTTNCQPPTGQEGFTLAALLVILTIMSMIIAFTVPEQWSLIMRREREKQTIFLMKQFARGIASWEKNHQGLPVSLEQLQKARQPRMLRSDGNWVCPLTGREDDWITVPPTAIAPAGAVVPPTTPNAPALPSQGSKLNPELSPKGYSGPFVAVRPNAKGASLIKLNGAEDYSEWVYTLQDLKDDLARQQMAMSAPQ